MTRTGLTLWSPQAALALRCVPPPQLGGSHYSLLLLTRCMVCTLQKRDITPDVVGGLLEKNAPGLVQAMLAAGMKVVPTAILSRPVAGIRGST